MKISKLTRVQKELFVEEFLRFRGQEDLVRCIDMDIDLKSAFPWNLTNQGHEFWMDIDNGKQPSITVPESSNCCKVLEMTKEAEHRGFALGVWTKYGQIVTNDDHELLPNGDFYYRNIKVFKNGKWIKAGQMPKQEDIERQQRNAEMFNELLPLLKKIQSMVVS